MTESQINERYDASLAAQIEAKWQKKWEELGSYHADNPVGDLAGPNAEKPRFFLLDMFPYPSGKGLHVGHPLGYIATDVVGRFQRMQGKNVLHTMSYDAFGLPAEQYAVQTGQHPRITTEENIANMERQLRRIGLGHDRRRTFSTTDEEYVKWTQWIFLQVFNSWYDFDAPARNGQGQGRARKIEELRAELENGTRQLEDGRAWAELSEAEKRDYLDSKRLAYVTEARVNWCPGLGTVLANEEVTADGRSERGNYPVFPAKLRQWMMRITDYADRLEKDLETIDWPEKVAAMQRNWIGRSEGARVTFPFGEESFEVYTTRPDTLFGASFCVLSPEHPLLADLTETPAEWPEGTREAWTGGFATPREAVETYQEQAAKQSEMDRAAEDKEKTGVFTGRFATNPVTGEQIPVFTGDYVMMGYGTGAIMAVPAHDQRDFDFAKKYDLDIRQTISAPEDYDGETAWVEDGTVINSANDQIDINGLDKAQAKAKMTQWLESAGIGKAATSYRLRDWLFSRQRYWGEPFPVVYDEEGRIHALPESMLPVQLPEMEDFKPRAFDPEDRDSEPEPPLGRVRDWVEVELDLGEGLKKYYRDTNTMPQWAGSCWYEMRYADPHNDQAMIDPENEKYWLGAQTEGASGGADLYVGGVEHAVLHLLYARFWHKILFDLGFISSSEPFHKLFNQGYVQAYAYTDQRGQYVPADEVEGDEQTGFTYQGQPVNREYGKMGKSLKNIVTPDEMCDEYGADTFRVYEMSMGPLDMSRPWDTRAVVGSQRFLQRLWRNVIDENTGEVTVTDEAPDLPTQKLVARTIVEVTEEYRNMRVNTAIAKMIVLNNHLTGLNPVPRAAVEPLILMVAPVAPHLAEELWERLGHAESLITHDFPVVTDTELLKADEVTCIIQINGKVRAKLEVDPEIAEADLETAARETAAVSGALAEGTLRKVIVRAPKLVNFVITPQK
ncbi:leucine--tRNA ligase [Boudabousia liubingyangii]|uniref:Leucine--tRNA ligase n=1 Tax=Boudabousia liubingyangii TaxID=1921764 RepID=A0A1Q5PKQ6_9ACTO|nr:leucine--tRNA ligase [Boudabousia liubingyangii]OKL47214.1 leucine--tRNA ligase [Boudabousia liubingyangii]